jgi:hypothetical protein
MARCSRNLHDVPDGSGGDPMRRVFVLLLAMVVSTHVALGSEFGEFVSPLIYRGVEGQARIVELVAPFSFRDPKGKIWTVPPGARVDGASIPQAFWSVIGGPFTGKYREASVIHDHYCDTKSESWEATHRVFYDGMRAKGVDPVTANVMYAAVYRYGPRWLKVADPVAGARVIVGQPIPDAIHSVDVKSLASRPGITPEQIRQELDKVLSPPAGKAAGIVRDNSACTVALAGLSRTVAELERPDATTVLCQVDEESSRLLAKRNLQILVTDVRALQSMQAGLLIPAVNQYIAEPTDQRWQLVQKSSEEVKNFVTLALISLQQYENRHGQGVISDAGPASSTFLNRPLGRILGARAVMLEDNRLSPPKSADEMTRWKNVYLDLMRRLSGELAELETRLK